MKTDKKQSAPTQDEIARVLSAVSAEDLSKMAVERRQAELQPTIEEYNTCEKQLVELKKKIQSINPDWHPPTLADRILSFITEKGKPTEADILTEFKQTATRFMLKN